MFSFFKSNNPGVVVAYLVYLVLFRLCWFWLPVPAPYADAHHEPLAQAAMQWINNLSHAGLWLIVAGGVLQFIQALIINGIVNGNKITGRKNYAVGLCYIILSSFLAETTLFSPASLSLTFVLLAISRMFPLIKKDKAYATVFDGGFFSAVAVLFYFPQAVWLLFGFVVLGTVRPFVLREWTSLLLGWLAPFFVVFVWYLWCGSIPAYFTDVVSLPWQHNLSLTWFTPFDWVAIIILLVFYALSGFVLPGILYSSLIQVRKYSTLLLALVLVYAAAFFIQPVFEKSFFQLPIMPISILTGMGLVSFKREGITEVIHLILLLLALLLGIAPAFITL